MTDCLIERIREDYSRNFESYKLNISDSRIEIHNHLADFNSVKNRDGEYMNMHLRLLSRTFDIEINQGLNGYADWINGNSGFSAVVLDPGNILEIQQCEVENKRAKAANDIQAWWRARECRTHNSDQQYCWPEYILEGGAVQIQRIWRGKAVRNRDLVEEERRRIWERITRFEKSADQCFWKRYSRRAKDREETLSHKERLRAERPFGCVRHNQGCEFKGDWFEVAEHEKSCVCDPKTECLEKLNDDINPVLIPEADALEHLQANFQVAAQMDERRLAFVAEQARLNDLDEKNVWKYR